MAEARAIENVNQRVAEKQIEEEDRKGACEIIWYLVSFKVQTFKMAI